MGFVAVVKFSGVLTALARHVDYFTWLDFKQSSQFSALNIVYLIICL